MVLRASPLRKGFYIKGLPSFGWPSGEPLMPACTDRVSQTPDDPIDSARGPSYLASCRQRLISGLSGGHLRMPPPPRFAIPGDSPWQHYVTWELQSPEAWSLCIRPTRPHFIKRTRTKKISDDPSDLCRLRVRFVQRGLETSPFSAHGVGGLDTQTIDQLNGTESLDSLYLLQGASRLSQYLRLRVHCECDKGIRGVGGCVWWYRSSHWSRVVLPERSVMALVLLDLPASARYGSPTPPDVHTADDAFQLSMVIFTTTAYHVFQRGVFGSPLRVVRHRPQLL